MKTLKWKHPHQTITETLCSKHEQLIVECLVTLGIGFVMDDTTDKVCVRCIYDGYPFSQWMKLLDD